MPAQPLVKWVGGKRKLAPKLLSLFPRTIGTYYEPFTGGGAVFFALAAETPHRFDSVVLNDWNFELADMYRVVRDTPNRLIVALREMVNTPEFFAQMRAKSPKDLKPVDRVARLIYLNKTCFNGLFRMNKAGQFNAPFGKYENPNICDEENIHACHVVLNGKVTVRNGDFSDAVTDAKPGDCVYFDPPYVPLTPTSNFTSYTSDGFGLKDQQRLALLVRQLAERGVHAYVSNSDTPLVRELYQGFELVEVQMKRNINSKGDGRGAVGELIVVGSRTTIPQTVVESAPG